MRAILAACGLCLASGVRAGGDRGLPPFEPLTFRRARAATAPPAPSGTAYSASTTWPKGYALVYYGDGGGGHLGVLAKALVDNEDYRDINCAVSEAMRLRGASGAPCKLTGYPPAIMSAEFFMYITGARAVGAPAQYLTLEEAQAAPGDGRLVEKAARRPWVAFVPRPRFPAALQVGSPQSPIYRPDAETEAHWRWRLGRDPRLAVLLARRDRIDDLDSCLSFGRASDARPNPPWIPHYCGDAFQGGAQDGELACRGGTTHLRCQLECARRFPALNDDGSAPPAAPVDYAPGPCPDAP